MVDLDALRAYIDAAQTPFEREARKREVFQLLYSLKNDTDTGRSDMKVGLEFPKHAAPTLFEKLTSHDNCDRCGYSDGSPIAQARVRVVLDDLSLTLCGHHFTKHELELMQHGWTVYEDARAGLLGQPGVSA